LDDSIVLIDFMRDGGILMWPILFVSVVALGITIERFISLRRATIDTRVFMSTVRQVLREGQTEEAIHICDQTDVPVSRILRAGLLKNERPKADIRDAIEDAGNLEIPRLERYLSALATCATVAPMMGLLGTVQGIIMAFAQIQNKRGQVNPGDLAEGISTALYTTAFGLAVAIPVLVVYNYFVTRVENMVVEMEISSSELVDLLTQGREERDDWR
jgi:biopolymer transport protein ExbB